MRETSSAQRTKREKVCAVYIIQCLANGRVYVGSSREAERRRREHFKKLRANEHDNSHLQAAWNKYGPLFFRFDIVAYPAPGKLIDTEQVFIDAAFATGLPFNMNRSASTRPPLATKQERDVAAKLASVTRKEWATLSNRAIAERLGLARRTVEIHRPESIPTPGASREYLSAATKRGFEKIGYVSPSRRISDEERARRVAEKVEADRREKRERIKAQPVCVCAYRRCGVEFSSLRPNRISRPRRHYCSLTCRWAEEAQLRHPQRMERKRRRRAMGLEQ